MEDCKSYEMKKILWQHLCCKNYYKICVELKQYFVILTVKISCVIDKMLQLQLTNHRVRIGLYDIDQSHDTPRKRPPNRPKAYFFIKLLDSILYKMK